MGTVGRWNREWQIRGRERVGDGERTGIVVEVGGWGDGK